MSDSLRKIKHIQGTVVTISKILIPYFSHKSSKSNTKLFHRNNVVHFSFKSSVATQGSQ
uniref:Uncharacterized protein n=1 Tax=Rhizophora mucronata TaxID=61149 RepID=A0A2P2J0X4_RHIMU